MRVNSASCASNSFCADCLISREYLATRTGAFQAGCAVLLVRNALFLTARFRHKTVPEVLPDRSVFFQVDQNTDLAAFSSVTNWIPLMVPLSFSDGIGVLDTLSPPPLVLDHSVIAEEL